MGQDYELGAADDAFCQVLKKREISISDSNNCSKIKGRFCCTENKVSGSTLKGNEVR